MRILIADDHTLFRDCLSLWLEQLSNQVDIIMAATYQEVLNHLGNEEKIDLILLDLSMPDMQGTLSIEKIYSIAKKTAIAVISADERREVIRFCFDLGLAGYISKSTDGETLINWIRRILDGQRCFPVIDLCESYEFNHKQKQIMALLAEGCSNKDIATKLFLSEGTIKQYVSEILKQMGVDNRVQAAIKAREYLGIGGNGV